MTIGPKTWMIAEVKTITLDENGIIDLGKLGLITLVDIEGRDAIQVFTTEEKANDYIRVTNEKGKLAPVAIPNLAILGTFLKDVLKAGIAERISFDPLNKTGMGESAPLDQFLTGLVSEMNRFMDDA